MSTSIMAVVKASVDFCIPDLCGPRGGRPQRVTFAARFSYLWMGGMPQLCGGVVAFRSWRAVTGVVLHSWDGTPFVAAVKVFVAESCDICNMVVAES